MVLYLAEKPHVGVIPRIAGAFPGFRLDTPGKHFPRVWDIHVIFRCQFSTHVSVVQGQMSMIGAVFDNLAVWHEISPVLLGLMARISEMEKINYCSSAKGTLL